METDVFFFAKYPFLKESIQYLRDNGVVLDEVIVDRGYERARALGKKRVYDAIEKGTLGGDGITSEADCIVQMLSYPIARMFVSTVSDPYLINRYSLAEATRLNALLQEETGAVIVQISKELGVEMELQKDNMKMHFVDFLKYGSRMKSKEWKLVNQVFSNGYVYLPKERAVRLIQNRFRDKILDELPLSINDRIIDSFGGDVKDMKKMVEAKKKSYKAEDVGRISITRTPPCIRKLLAMAQAGENLPHSGRFALAAFLRNLGLKSSDILNIFSRSPDFDPSKAKYQIDHISGDISGVEYTPPSCRTMKSYGICYDPDELCQRDWMNHPLTYYRSKGKRKRNKIKDEKD